MRIPVPAAWPAVLVVLGLAGGPVAVFAQSGEESEGGGGSAGGQSAAEAIQINGEAGAGASSEEEASAFESTVLPGTTVIGSKPGTERLPGSGYYVDTEEIRRQSYDDINRILRRVPGVYVREEDGFGLFPNISLRGVDPARSAKVTIMEDGVLQAPAPYSAPSAYYSPTAGRMHAIEVLKGSSQIRYGPHITGGVINYLSTPVPQGPTGYVKTLYGEENEVRIHAYQGQTLETEKWGDIGYLVEGYLRRTDGFKDFDPLTPDFRGGDTGFTNVEPMVKLRWEPDAATYQRFEFKYGYTDREGDVGYLGLSEEDFGRDPYNRYPATRFDNINAYQNRTYFKHYGEWTDQLSTSFTAYYNNFHRNWFKLHELGDYEGDPNPGESTGLSQALAGIDMGRPLEVLRGERAGEFNVRANNRDYYSWGLQLVPTYEFAWGATEHELELGVRYHSDRIRRFQWSEDFEQNDEGAIIDRTRNPDGSAGNRRQETDAIALHVRDEISFGRWTVTPGVRFEHLDLDWTEFDDDPTNTPVDGGEGSLDVIGGGVGVTYDWSDEWQVFGGVHRGFSTPSPRAHLDAGLEEETSIALETGLRYESPRGALRAEATGFYTMYDDLIGVDIAGGTGTDDASNVGEVDTAGLELLVEYDPGIALDWGFNMPNYLSFTYTNAELASDTTGDPESIFSGGREGNEVPYIPEYLLTVGTGVEFDRVGLFATGNFVSSVFTTASNTSQQVDPEGNPDARFGELDARFIVDVSAHYQLNEDAKVMVGAHNVFDEEYVASRLPHGPRPGKPRFGYVALELNF